MKAGLVKKILKWTAITLAAIFAALQFIRPARTNPPIRRIPHDSGSLARHAGSRSHHGSLLQRLPFQSNALAVV